MITINKSLEPPFVVSSFYSTTAVSGGIYSILSNGALLMPQPPICTYVLLAYKLHG